MLMWKCGMEVVLCGKKSWLIILLYMYFLVVVVVVVEPSQSKQISAAATATATLPIPNPLGIITCPIQRERERENYRVNMVSLSTAIVAPPPTSASSSPPYSCRTIPPSSNPNYYYSHSIHSRPNSLPLKSIGFGIGIRGLFFKVPTPTPNLRHSTSKPVMQLQDCTTKMEVDVPVSLAYKCYSDREAMPQWMPFISSVKVLEDKPDLSRWTLKYKAFGRDIEFSWLARNLQPIPNQKIHWRSLEGLQNSGAVRFYPRGPSSCLIELTVSYEVPQLLVPVASALQPFLESLLLRGLERFSKFAKTYQPDSTA